MKTTKNKNDQKPKTKTTKNEDDQKRRRPKIKGTIRGVNLCCYSNDFMVNNLFQPIFFIKNELD